MNRKLALPLISLAAAAGLLAGCGNSSSSSSGHVPAGLASSAGALASVPGADAKQVLIRAGVPVSGTSAQQIAFGRAMLVKSSRKALAEKLAIPPQNKAVFEASLLDAAKADHVLTKHTGRVKFFDVDLPNLYAKALVVTS